MRERSQRPARGIGGLIFVIGIVAITLIGVPESRPSLAAAVPAGILVNALRSLWIKRRR